MSTLEEYKQQDQVFLELNYSRRAMMVIGTALMIASLLIGFNYDSLLENNSTHKYQFIIENSNLCFGFSILGFLSGAFLFRVSLIKLPSDSGFYLDKEGVKLISIPSRSFSAKWNEISDIVFRRTNHGNMIAFILKNEPRTSGLLRKKNHVSMNSLQVVIKRDDLYPLINHFWNKYKN